MGTYEAWAKHAADYAIEFREDQTAEAYRLLILALTNAEVCDRDRFFALTRTVYWPLTQHMKEPTAHFMFLVKFEQQYEEGPVRCT